LTAAAPVLLWRVSNHADLAGTGGMVASARWYTAGHPVVYLAESPSAALLENLVHLELDEEDRPRSYQMLKVAVESAIEPPVEVEAVAIEDLPDTWKSDEAATRAVGDAWLERGRTALLRVPSVLTPETWNWLLNPRHPDAARLRVVSAENPLYDSRLRG
jgi:RES domain-containing protein